MTSTTFGSIIGTAIGNAWDYIVAGLVTGNVWVYLIGVTLLGAVVGLVVAGVKHVFHRR